MNKPLGSALRKITYMKVDAAVHSAVDVQIVVAIQFDFWRINNLIESEISLGVHGAISDAISSVVYIGT